MRFEPIDIKEHRDYIIAFRRDSFVVSFGSDEDFGDEEEYLDWVRTRSSEFPQGFVMVWEDETPIGQIELTIREYMGKTIGYINLYYLIPEKRGLGLGKELHKYALHFFKGYGVGEYHLRVSPTNRHALPFYYKNGIQRIGFEYGGKVIRMKGIIANKTSLK
ncbi:MAG: GNAT family N-acetyltransferase [Tissierellaceae bacterium]